MELRETIEKRVSTREYSIENIDRKVIEDLIDCARLAPSAANRQPWHFLVLEGESKKKVADILLKKYKEEKDISDNSKPTKEYKPVMSLVNSVRIISEAPVLLLVFREKNIDWLEGDYLSIGCAVEHICLRATDLGLGTLWIRDVIYMREEISKLFKKNNMELVTGLAIGYSTEYPYERKKKSLADILEWHDK